MFLPFCQVFARFWERAIVFLEKQGINHGICHKRDLEEAASAYKNINKVMKNQDDLVDVVVELKPLAVIKG